MRILPTGDKNFDEAIRKLTKGIRSLAGTDGRKLARRTARQRVLKALRRVRTIMDEQAPAIVERGEVKRLTPEGRIARMKRKGWASVSAVNAGVFATSGVPVRSIKWTTPEGNNVVGKREMIFVPRWATIIGAENPTRLRAAKKSVQLQKAVLAEHTLANSV